MGFCFGGFFLGGSFVLVWCTDFDLGLPTLGVDACGVWCADLVLGLPTLGAGACGLSAICCSAS